MVSGSFLVTFLFCCLFAIEITQVESKLMYERLSELNARNGYGCDHPCNDGDVAYELEAVIKKIKINGNMKDFTCTHCNNKEPFESGGDVYATVRSFRATSKKQSPYCDFLKDYNGANGFTGPCLLAKPGQVLSVKLINNFGDWASDELESWKTSKSEWWRYQATGVAPPSKFELADQSIENNPGWDADGRVFDFTNLHFHGLEIGPHMFYPEGTRLLNASWIQAETTNKNGKQCYCYQLGIAKEQTPGTYLYHIHRHGSTALQMWSGMFGLIQVGGKDYKQSLDWELPNKFGVKRDIPFAVWGPALRYRGTASEFKSDPVNDDGSTNPYSKAKPGDDIEMEINSYMNNFLNKAMSPILVGNSYQPSYDLAAGEIVRIRLVCAFAHDFCAFAIVPDIQGIDPLDAKNQIDFYSIAIDGISFTSPIARKRIILSPGQREDILVKIIKPGKYLVRSDGLLEMGFKGTSENSTIARFDVKNKVFVNDKKPPKDITKWKLTMTPQRVPISESDVVATRIFNFRFAGVAAQRVIPTVEFHINNVVFDIDVINTISKFGTTEKWIFTADFFHSFHIHINPFVVTDIQTSDSAVLSKRYNVDALIKNQLDNGPLWRDTVTIPPSGNVTILTRFSATDPNSGDPLIGRSVYHCHLESHSDLGMIQSFQVDP